MEAAGDGFSAIPVPRGVANGIGENGDSLEEKLWLWDWAIGSAVP
jgi:hypothetical protein